LLKEQRRLSTNHDLTHQSHGAFSECGDTNDIIIYDNKNNKANDF
jgi:hypothetical protein